MNYLEYARYIILEESNDLKKLADSLDENFSKACEILKKSKGHIIVTGMGKSGHIANKIAATFSSTGTPAFFVHPAESSHGDLGMITPDNVVLVISNSGETREILDLLEYCKKFNISIIGITSKKESTLGKYSNVVLTYPLEKEACYLNLAPTSSTIMSLALGDALAVALYKSKNFSKVDFSLYHPGGKLGKLLLKVKDVMRQREEIAIVKQGTSMREAILEMSSHIGGCVFIVDDQFVLIGMITDGDIRRHILENILNDPVENHMTKNPKICDSESLIVDSIRFMNDNRITQLPILKDNILIGMIHLHDLIKLGFN